MRHIGCPTHAKIILYIHSQFNISNKARPGSINYLSKVDNPVCQDQGLFSCSSRPNSGGIKEI